MRTVELLLDDELDGAVRAVWRRLAQANLPSLAHHPHPTNRPHVTLAAADVVPDLDLSALPLPVTLDGLVFFAGRSGMLVWRVVPDAALLALQSAVWHALHDPNPLHAPDVWVPHVSLARRVRQADRARMSDFLAGLRPRQGRLVAARSYDTESRTVTAL
jgi:2'-5' RNA ligase